MKRNLFVLSCECMFLFLSTFIPKETMLEDKKVFTNEKASSVKIENHELFAYQVPKIEETFVEYKPLPNKQELTVSFNEVIDVTTVKKNESDDVKQDKVNDEYDDNKKELSSEIEQVDAKSVNNEEKVLVSENTQVLDNPINDYTTNEDANIFIEKENNEDDVKIGYYSPNGTYLGDSKVKVIDVSHHQGKINWNDFANYSDCYGVILRIGYYKTLDKQFENNIKEIKRLNIPYGIYLFSYASSVNGAATEMNFTNQVIDKYDLNPTLGIYYDIESWSTKTSSSNNISKLLYDEIIGTYVNGVSTHVNNKYKVKLYSGRWYAMNRLGNVSKAYVDWVAEYNSTCKYDGLYSMWQYTSKGNVPGINGYVDISYLY